MPNLKLNYVILLEMDLALVNKVFKDNNNFFFQNDSKDLIIMV